MTGDEILVVGQSGQLARALVRLDTIAGRQVICTGRPDLDLAQPETVQEVIERIAPVLVINAAAYTAVDQAESEPETAFAINADGVGVLGRLCARRQIPMIHVSTDYVFDGSATQPYAPDDPVAPQGAYGRSKAAGEAVLREVLDRHIILRTAWVFSDGGKNFLTTMIGAGAVRSELRVVDDQHGSPTYAADLAQGIAEIATRILREPQNSCWGTYHLTNSGATTWCGFAREIFACQARTGVAIPEVVAITTADYPTPARRPKWSVLDCAPTERAFGVCLPDWKDATARCIAQLSDQE